MQLPNFDTTVNLNLIIAVLAILATLGVAAYFQWWRNRRRLSFRVLSSLSLLTTHEEIEDDMEILFQGHSVKAVKLVVLKLFNDGYKAIKKADFEEPVRFTLKGDDVRILSVSRAEQTPLNLGAVPTLVDEGTVEISPALFNRGDSIQFALFVNSNKFDIEVTARIEEVSKIREVSPDADELNMTLICTVAAALLSGVTYIFLKVYRPELSPDDFIVTWVGLGIACTVPMVGVFAFVNFLRDLRK